MYVIPTAVMEKVRREAQSALPNAPVVPHEELPARRTLRSRIPWTWRSSRPRAAVCEAEGRDRSAQAAGAAGPG